MEIVYSATRSEAILIIVIDDNPFVKKSNQIEKAIGLKIMRNNINLQTNMNRWIFNIIPCS
jgi:hypothetical protein